LTVTTPDRGTPTLALTGVNGDGGNDRCQWKRKLLLHHRGIPAAPVARRRPVGAAFGDTWWVPPE
jgi:hypothetical protein